MPSFRKLLTKYINGEKVFNFGGLVPGILAGLTPVPPPSPTPTPTITPSPTPTITPTITPTSSPTSTPTPTPTITPTTSPSFFYYDAQDCSDPFAAPIVVKSTTSLLIGSAVKVIGDYKCYEILNVGFAPEDQIVDTTYVDCATCLITISPTPTPTPTLTPTPTPTPVVVDGVIMTEDSEFIQTEDGDYLGFDGV